MAKGDAGYMLPEDMQDLQFAQIGPCPFCGDERVYHDELDIADLTYFFVCCPKCGAEGPLSLTPVEATDKWNSANAPRPSSAGSRE